MSDAPYILITADTHAGGSHAQYRDCLDPEWREPFDDWRGAYLNPDEAHFARRKLRNWDLAVRTEDQNSQGVVGEVVFPNTVPPFFPESVVTAQPPRPKDYPRALAGIRAHNRWLKDFCAEDPVRRAGIGLILPNDLDEAVRDIEFIAESGLRGGVLLPLIPPDCDWLKPLYHPDWDRVLAAIQDHDLVMNQHSGQGLPRYGRSIAAQAIWMSEVTFYCQAGYRHLLLSGAYERFPKLKYILTESGCAWVTPMLQQLDRLHEGFVRGGIGEMNYKGAQWVLKLRPSEYAARNCWYGASFPSKAELDGVELIGEDRVLWGNDYPHLEGTFPYNLESLRLTFAGMPDVRRRKILGENAAALYGFDLGALRPLADEVGPTPREIDQPLPLSDVPRDSTCYLFQNVLQAA